MTTLSRRELLLLLLIFTLVMAWSSLPDWAGIAAQDARVAFGGTYFDPQDYAVHISMMRAGMAGAWSYHLRFTTEPHTTAYIRLFYILLGEANRLFRLPPELMFQVARWVFGYCALFSIYLLARRCLPEARWRWLAFSLAILGSGVGWLQRVFGWVPTQITPIDFWLIDAYVLFALSLFPHFALTLTLMCMAWLWYLDYLENRGPVLIAAIIGAAWIVQLVNPVAFVLADIAIATSTLVHWLKSPQRRALSDWAGLFLIGLAQIPLVLYALNLLTRVSIWSQFTAQDQTLSPSPVYYLWGYALLWPLALLGSISAFRERSTIMVGAVAWIVAGFSLAYAPFDIQRRFLLGITIPLGVLGARGMMNLSHSVTRRYAWLQKRVPSFILLTGLLVCMTSLLLIPAQAFYMLQQPEDLFYPRSLDRAFQWITADTAPDDFILATTRTAQLVAQKTGRRVYAGHEMETIDFATKTEQVESFYESGTSPGWLKSSPVEWVIYGPYERQAYPSFHPDASLRLVFQAKDIAIYRNLGVPKP